MDNSLYLQRTMWTSDISTNINKRQGTYNLLFLTDLYNLGYYAEKGDTSAATCIHEKF